MISNDFVLIDKVHFKGISTPILFFSGRRIKKGSFMIKADNNNIPLYNNTKLGMRYVYNRILKQDQEEFCYICKLTKGVKKISIIYNDIEIVTLKTNILKRFFYSFYQTTNKFIKKIVRFPKICFKVVKTMWHRHHFLVPPRLFKQYISSFFNNINNKNIDEILYNPLIPNDYEKWISEQKEEKVTKLKYNPLISIIIPTYNVSEKLLNECLESILNQSYKNFEICIADDSSTLDETIKTLKKYESNDKIKIIYRSKNGHISEASNTALSIANGEFIALVDNDDVLDKNALYYMVKKLNNDKSLDLIYSDEDKLDLKGNRCVPFFKPDYSPDTLLTVNYICHFTMIRKKIVDEIGGFRSEYNGAQDYDLFLRIINKTKRIGHVSRILYHWRMTETSTALNGANKNYALKNGKKALEDYFKKNSISADVSIIENSHMYQINYLIDKEPKISIIIPTKDKWKILKKCIDSIYEKTIYSNFEIIVIDNNSIENKTFEVLNDYKNKHDNFTYYRLECEFNFSYINNYAVSKAKGEYIVLLNNDTEVITPTWLNTMVGYAAQKHIGCVGVKLLYPNKTIQHFGVVTGVGGVAMHAQSYREESGYFGRLVGVYDWSCVTAACLMIDKKKYIQAGGLDENLKVAFNDVDFCLKNIELGYYNVVLPQIELFHFESLSRGNDVSNSNYTRFKSEIDYMCDKWKDKLLNDKFYNCNLSKLYTFRLDKKDDSNE